MNEHPGSSRRGALAGIVGLLAVAVLVVGMPVLAGALVHLLWSLFLFGWSVR